MAPATGDASRELDAPKRKLAREEQTDKVTQEELLSDSLAQTVPRDEQRLSPRTGQGEASNSGGATASDSARGNASSSSGADELAINMQTTARAKIAVKDIQSRKERLSWPKGTPVMAVTGTASVAKLEETFRTQCQHVTGMMMSSNRGLIRDLWVGLCFSTWHRVALGTRLSFTFAMSRHQAIAAAKFSLERSGYLLRVQQERYQLSRFLCGWSKALVQCRMERKVLGLYANMEELRKTHEQELQTNKDRTIYLICQMHREPVFLGRFFKIWKQSIQLSRERAEAEAAAADCREVREHLVRLDRLQDLSNLGRPTTPPPPHASGDVPHFGRLESPRALVAASPWSWPPVGVTVRGGPLPEAPEGEVRTSAMLWAKIAELEGYMVGVDKRLTGAREP